MSRTTIKKVWKQIWKCYLVECPYLTDSIQSFAVLSAHFLTLFFISCSLFRFLNRLFLLVCELFLLISTRLLIVPLSLLVYQSFLQGSACSHLHSFTICFYSFISRLLSSIIYQPFLLVYQSFTLVRQSFYTRLPVVYMRLPVVYHSVLLVYMSFLLVPTCLNVAYVLILTTFSARNTAFSKVMWNCWVISHLSKVYISLTLSIYLKVCRISIVDAINLLQCLWDGSTVYKHTKR